jgi:hypothetical protein
VDTACPLCGAPLDPRQEWCLNCGAAARTRLAAPTNWKAPIVAIAVIATLALGVLAAALVKLSGGSGTPTVLAPVTRTITTTTPIVPGTTPGTTLGTTPGTIPTTTTGANGAAGLGGVVAPSPTTTGAGIPGTPTTIRPSTTTGGLTATATTPTATTPSNTGTGSRAAEEALRKAGFLPRTKK